MGLHPEALPTVTLPVSVDMYGFKWPSIDLFFSPESYPLDRIKHPGEVAGKSTAVHARILSPHHVSIYDYPTVPKYPDLAKVVLVYPKEVLLFAS